MLHKISRYLIVIVTVFVLSNVLPHIYNTLFDVRIDLPFVSYSIINEDFIISRRENGETVYTGHSPALYTYNFLCYYKRIPEQWLSGLFSLP